MTRSMLIEKKLPHTLWGEVVATASYVLNRCLTKEMKEIIPIQKWTRDKQSVIHLKVFVSVCYKHIPDAKRRKLDGRSKVMLCVGYHSTSSYKLYYIVTNEVDFNRDVIVKESEACSNSATVLTSQLTFEDILDSERDSESEDEPESEGDTNAEVQYDSKGEPDDLDSDNDSYSNGNQDSNDDPDSSGNPSSKGGPSKDEYSEFIVYEGGSSEVIASEGGPASETRPQINRQIPRRLAEFELLQDTEIDSEGEVIPCAIVMDSKIVNT